MFSEIRKSARAILVAVLAAFSMPALAGGSTTYHVTVTNLTHSISFTPILVASQRRPVSILELGAPASDELAAIAEGGNIAPLMAVLEADPQVVDVQHSSGLLAPGQSVTIIVDAGHGARYISLASMLLPTNDGFIALDAVRAGGKHAEIYFSPGYDAGSEANDELCANIPGPTCGGAGESPIPSPLDEGYVHVHRGIHGVGNLDAATYDWRNPVARISIQRVKGD